MKSMSAREAKNAFGLLLDTAWAEPIVSGKSICIELQGISDRGCTAGDPVIMLLSS